MNAFSNKKNTNWCIPTNTGCFRKKCLNVRQKLGTTIVWMFECSEQLLFLCVSSKVIVCHAIYHMSHCACHMSYVKCLCWSLGHAEQRLFSCLCSKVAVYSRKLQSFFFDLIFFDLSITLTCYIRVHRAGSQLTKFRSWSIFAINNSSKKNFKCFWQKLGISCVFVYVCVCDCDC